MGTPRHSDRTGELNRSWSYTIDHVTSVGGKPWICHRTDFLGRGLPILRGNLNQEILCHVKFKTLISSAQDLHDLPDIDLLVRLD